MTDPNRFHLDGTGTNYVQAATNGDLIEITVNGEVMMITSGEARRYAAGILDQAADIDHRAGLDCGDRLCGPCSFRRRGL